MTSRQNPFRSSVTLFALALLTVSCTPSAFAQSSPQADAFPPPVTLNHGWTLQDGAKIAASGETLSSPGFQPVAWHQATVPGTVLTSLVNDGVYPEPLYGENNRPDTIPDSLCRTAYWYRTQFRVPKSYQGRSVQLNFDGINYMADVWLNGHDLGAIKGAFARGDFDVTSAVNRTGVNTLAIDILPPPHPGVPQEHTIANGLGCGGVLASDGPTFLCTVAWDWIPGIRDRDMGIWQDVFLSAHGPVTLGDTDVTSDIPLPRLDSAELTIKTTVANKLPRPVDGVLEGAFGTTTFRYPMTIGAGATRDVTLTPADLPQLHVTNPRLWWPNGYGPQNLYALKLKFIADGAVSDAQDTPFGVRKITYAVPGTDNLTISVNGVPVLCKGGDWGMDEALKREPYKRLDAQIRLHRDAHYTMIRNWVGQSTSEDFYDLCDKYGILIWDEFFQPNPHDGPNPDDIDLYMANVREKILRFRSHPSIALWCGRNEGPPPPEIDSAIRTLTTQIDPSRLYQSSSTDGRGVNSGGPYYWRAPRDYYNYGEAFKTEIGSVSIPTLETVEAMMPKKDWNTIDNDWAEHDLAKGGSGGDWYPRTIAQRYGAFASLPDFVRKGQMADYEAFRAMYEGRNAKLFAPVTGVLTWMSNPAQPSFVWQIYDWYLEPNASFFGVQKACEPVHTQLNQNDWHVMVINNTPKPLDRLSASVSIYDLDGSLKATHTDTLTAAPSAATDDGVVTFPADVSPVHFVKLELRDSENHLISDNFYWRETTQDDLTALNTLPIATLTGRVSRQDAGDNILLTVTLTNPTKTPALMTHLLLKKASGQRVLPVYYGGNYLSLMPGDTKTVSIEAAKSDLGSAAPQVVIDGWNVTVKPGAGLAPNTGAIVTASAKAAKPPVTDTVRINCGGGDAGPYVTFGHQNLSPQDFVGDEDFDIGSTSSYGAAINTSAPNAADQSVYQSERWGESTYTIPMTRNKTYVVRLHFAETTFDHPGARLFNVEINGQRELTDFDIFKAAGGKDIAVVKEFQNVQPDSSGNIMIRFLKGSADQPAIDGIEVLPS